MQSLNPYVGQIVDFYPSNNRRLAAIITEIHPFGSHSPTLPFRPTVNLHVWAADGKTEIWEDVEPVEHSADEQFPELKERWGYQHEFFLQQDETIQPEDFSGTQSNEHVGQLNSVI